MTEPQIIEKLVYIMEAQFTGITSENAIAPELSLRDDLGYDSLDHVELIILVEKEFKINIPDKEAEEISTIADLIHTIQHHLKPKQ